MKALYGNSRRSKKETVFSRKKQLLNTEYLRLMIFLFIMLLFHGKIIAADKIYTQTTKADFSRGTNSGTRVSSDGKVMLAVDNNPVVEKAAIDWGMAICPVDEDPDYIWVEAEDVIPSNSEFWCMPSGLQMGLGEHRFSNDPAVYSNLQNASSGVFNIDLPLENMISNPKYETELSSSYPLDWIHGGSATYNYITNGTAGVDTYEGTHSIAITHTTGGGACWQSSGSCLIPVEFGTTYKLSLYAKTENFDADDTAYAALYLFDSSQNFIGLQTDASGFLSGNHDWTLLSFEKTFAANVAYVKIALYYSYGGNNSSYVNGRVYFDNVSLVSTDTTYDVYIRTEHWNGHGLSSTLQLYVDDVLCGSVTPGSLAWKKVPGTISGGSHDLYVKVIADPNETLPALIIDEFLFTTDTNYTPPNPVDTNGKIDNRFIYTWIEAEDIIPSGADFWDIPSGLSIGQGEHRWSNDPAVYTNKQEAVSGTFNLDLPFTGSSYDIHIRTESWNGHGLSSTLQLYVDGSLCGSVTPGAGSLAWKKVPGTISGGSHTLYVKAIADSNETLPALVIDEFLFTTDTNYTPPNPVDTNGKILGASLDSTGTFTSMVIDTGTDTLSWRYIKWTEELPPGTAMTIKTRTGPTAVPDGGWSDWSLEYTLNSGEAIQSPVNRYIQYQAVLDADTTKTHSPILKELTIAASTDALPEVCKYGIYSIFYGDSGSIPSYIYWVAGSQVGYYDFSIIMSVIGNLTQYGQYGTLITDIKNTNPNHKVIIRLNAPWYIGVSLLDYYYNSADRTTVHNDWTASMTAAGANNVYGVTIGEENLVDAWSGWFSSTAPQWALDYASTYESETGKSFDWAGRNTNGYLTWLQGKTKWVFNDLYSWFKTNYSTQKVYQFMYIPEEDNNNIGWGAVNLEPDEYNADGWVLQYFGSYDNLYNAIKKLRDIGIANSDIYVQIWGHCSDNDSLVWQTLQVKSMGIENIFAFYFGAWIPPAYPSPCDYYGLDIYDGTQDGIFCGGDGRWSYDQRVSWEDFIYEERN